MGVALELVALKPVYGPSHQDQAEQDDYTDPEFYVI
jgi:hypothetical protein